LGQIRENINRFGYHVYVVSGEQQPRYAYTIGLSPKLGYEVIFAGGILFMYKEIGTIINGSRREIDGKVGLREWGLRRRSVWRFFVPKIRSELDRPTDDRRK